VNHVRQSRASDVSRCRGACGARGREAGLL